LPYWNIYEKEGKDQTILIGGTMAGEFTAGLSGGQRKILLFELIRQRIRDQVTVRYNRPSTSIRIVSSALHAR